MHGTVDGIELACDKDQQWAFVTVIMKFLVLHKARSLWPVKWLLASIGGLCVIKLLSQLSKYDIILHARGRGSKKIFTSPCGIKFQNLRKQTVFQTEELTGKNTNDTDIRWMIFVINQHNYSLNRVIPYVQLFLILYSTDDNEV